MSYLYTKSNCIVSSHGFSRRIAVDFDGVCAEITHDYYEIGDPVPGAIDILSNLRELGWYIVIWTSRVNAMKLEELSQAPNQYPKLMIGMLEWLEKHNFPYDELDMGHQKPACNIFIDDRAYRFYTKSPEKSWLEIFNQIIKNRGMEWKKSPLGQSPLAEKK